MFGFRAFFITLGALLSSIFTPLHKTIPQAKTDTNQKVIFQLEPSETPSASSFPTISPTPLPSITPASSFLSQFLYPQGTVIANSGNSMTIQTADSAQAVSSWYQQVINSLGFRAVSVVQTNTNGNALDVLDVANKSMEVKIQITRNGGDTMTTIVVTTSMSTANTVISNVKL